MLSCLQDTFNTSNIEITMVSPDNRDEYGEMEVDDEGKVNISKYILVFHLTNAQQQLQLTWVPTRILEWMESIGRYTNMLTSMQDLASKLTRQSADSSLNTCQVQQLEREWLTEICESRIHPVLPNRRPLHSFFLDTFHTWCSWCIGDEYPCGSEAPSSDWAQ